MGFRVRVEGGVKSRREDIDSDEFVVVVEPSKWSCMRTRKSVKKYYSLVEGKGKVSTDNREIDSKIARESRGTARRLLWVFFFTCIAWRTWRTTWRTTVRKTADVYRLSFICTLLLFLLTQLLLICEITEPFDALVKCYFWQIDISTKLEEVTNECDKKCFFILTKRASSLFQDVNLSCLFWRSIQRKSW